MDYLLQPPPSVNPTQVTPFPELLLAAQHATNSRLCVGLDPDLEKIPQTFRGMAPEEAVLRFCRDMIEATVDLACAYKPNLAFFEVLGAPGWPVLQRLIKMIPPNRVVIADAKRGDIGNSARMYATALFDVLGCSACTVSPYMGRDAITPFLDREGRATFILARTSNPGGSDLQELQTGDIPLYLRLAELIMEWSHGRAGTAGVVAGATDLNALQRLRGVLPGAPFLVPGVGAQGGDVGEVLSAAGSGPLIVNSSRQILYASRGSDYREAARDQAQELAESLRLV